MQPLRGIMLALFAAPAVLAGGRPGAGFRFGGDAGRARILADADQLDNVPEVTWPNRQGAGATPARATLIKTRSTTSGGDAWAHMQGLVDGLEKDAEDGNRDAAVEQAISAEKSAKDGAYGAAARTETSSEQRGMSSASDLDLVSAVKATRDYGAKTASRSPSWVTLRREVDGVSSHSESVWETKEWSDVDGLRSALSKTSGSESASQRQREREQDEEAQRAKERYDAVRRKQKGFGSAPVHSPLEDESVLLQATPAKAAAAAVKSKKIIPLTHEELERTARTMAKADKEESEAEHLIKDSKVELDALRKH